jgi:hypothetical protein
MRLPGGVGVSSGVAGLVIVPIFAKEGLDGLKGKACCDDCGIA